jgi:hypothetical protein
MKKGTKSIIALTIFALGLAQIGIVGAADGPTVSVRQLVEQSAKNDLQKQVNDLESNLKNLRAAYTPSGAIGLGVGPWPLAFQVSVAPLLQEAAATASDYQSITNKNFQDEYGYYEHSYGLWLLQKTAQYQLINFNLAANEKDMTQKKLEQGTASHNQMLQAEISYNQAYAAYQDALATKQSLLYAVNSTRGTSITQQIEVDDMSVEFLSEDDMNVDTILPGLLQAHTAFKSLHQAANAYQVAYDLAAKQTDGRVPVDGLKDYYTKEIQETDLKLKVVQQQMELLVRSSVVQLKNLEAKIKLGRESAEKMTEVYNNASKLYEVGMSTFDELETVRAKLVALQTQQAKDEGDYLLLKEKFRLLQKGAMF